MKLEDLFRVWDRFEESDISEVDFENEDGRISLKKKSSAAFPETSDAAVQAVTQKTSVHKNRVGGAPEKTEVPSGKKDVRESDEEGTFVSAPFVGTFYRASAPGEQPFIKMDQEVKKGDVLGIIEAMKLMNEITAPCDGKIASIYADDETFVEYGQKLVRII